MNQLKVLDWYHNTPKNANITLYIKNIKTLCNTLNSGNWNLGFVKLVVRWAERDTGLSFILFAFSEKTRYKDYWELRLKIKCYFL